MPSSRRLYRGRATLCFGHHRVGVEDSIVKGYTLHIINILVAPALHKLYLQRNAKGRTSLPVLANHQPLGIATSKETIVSIRDTGSFMDPRCKLGWWFK